MKPWTKDSITMITNRLRQDHLLGSKEKKAKVYQHRLCPVDLFEDLTLRYENGHDVRDLVVNMVMNPELPWALAERVLMVTKDPTISSALYSHFQNPTLQSLAKDKLKLYVNGILKDLPLSDSDLEGCVVAGNSLNFFMLQGIDNNPPPLKDIDVFFSNPETCERTLNKLINFFNFEVKEPIVFHKTNRGLGNNLSRKLVSATKTKIDQHGNYCGAEGVISENALTVKINSQELQFIFKIIESPDNIISQFDFAHCQAYWDMSSENLNFGKFTPTAIAKRKLIFNPQSVTALGSLFRLQKFLERGMKISRSEYLKIIQSLYKLDLQDPQVWKSQLTGFYKKEDDYPEIAQLSNERLTSEQVNNLIEYLTSKY